MIIGQRCREQQHHKGSCQQRRIEDVLTKASAHQLGDHDGEGTATAWGCDLTYDYVKINGDYRT